MSRIPPHAPRILLSGRPGCGKTTLIRSLVELIGPDHCSGFYTEEVREGRQRIGFDVVTLDGRRAPLARIGAPGPRVGRYGVDIGSFERLALPSLAPRGGPTPRRRVFVLDEIGKMELFSAEFVTRLGRLLDDPRRSLLGTVMVGRHPVVEPIRRRRDIEIVTVTVQNRERLVPQIGGIFVEFLSGPEAAAPT